MHTGSLRDGIGELLVQAELCVDLQFHKFNFMISKVVETTINRS